jgi:hypothetical protein
MEEDKEVRGMVKWGLVTPLVNYFKLIMTLPDQPIHELEEPLKSFVVQLEEDLKKWIVGTLQFASEDLSLDLRKIYLELFPKSLKRDVRIAIRQIFKPQSVREVLLKILKEHGLTHFLNKSELRD